MFQYLKKRKEQKEKEREINTEIFILENKRDVLFEKYVSTMIESKKIKVIEGEDKAIFEVNYNNTQNYIRDKDSSNDKRRYARLGNISFIKKGEIYRENGKYFLIIEYKEYELEKNITEEDHYNILNSLLTMDKEISEKYKQLNGRSEK